MTPIKTTRLKKYPKHEAADKSIATARDWLVAHGFHVSDPQPASANGPDLIAIKGGFGCRVEVKTASFDRGAWKVSKVTRQEDDYILTVFPSGAIHAESMQSHLSQCSKDGRRFMTAIGRIYG